MSELFSYAVFISASLWSAVAFVSIPSNLVLSAPVWSPAREVVAAGRVALVPSELVTVPVVAAVL